MVCINDFSYKEYLNIINGIKKVSFIKDFKEIDNNTSKFTVIRHDVEISVERAYEMAKTESKLCNICTSYFFQLRSNGYNIISKQSLEMIREIYNMGHKIGLHVHLGELKNIENIKAYIIKDIETMEYYTKLPIDRFSFHQPPMEILRLNIEINGLINAYNEKYFIFTGDKDYDNLSIKYFADSRHRWDYGYPDIENLIKHKKIQLLTHPFSWSEKGFNYEENFKMLINEKTKTLINTLDTDVR